MSLRRFQRFQYVYIILLVLRIKEDFRVELLGYQFPLIHVSRCKVIEYADHDKVFLLICVVLLLVDLIWIFNRFFKAKSKNPGSNCAS